MLRDVGGNKLHVALDDEFHPGKDDPGRTVYYTAAKGNTAGEEACYSNINPRRRFPCGATALS